MPTMKRKTKAILALTAASSASCIVALVARESAEIENNDKVRHKQETNDKDASSSSSSVAIVSTLPSKKKKNMMQQNNNRYSAQDVQPSHYHSNNKTNGQQRRLLRKNNSSDSNRRHRRRRTGERKKKTKETTTRNNNQSSERNLQQYKPPPVLRQAPGCGPSPGTHHSPYLGCYADKPTDRAFPYELYSQYSSNSYKRLGNSVLTCEVECTKLGYRYFGREYKGQCFCGNEIQRIVRYGVDNGCNCCGENVGGNLMCVWEVRLFAEFCFLCICFFSNHNIRYLLLSCALPTYVSTTNRMPIIQIHRLPHQLSRPSYHP